MKKKILAGVMFGVLVLQMTAGSVPAEEAVDQEQIEAEDERFGTGTIDGQIYEQTFFGFRVELDENWAFANDEERAAMGNALTELASDEVKEEIDKGNGYLDMYAENNVSFENINATISKMSTYEALMFRADSEGMVGEMLDQIREEMAYMGFAEIEVEQDETEFLGETVPCIRITSYPEAVGGDIALHQTQIFIQRGTYLCAVTASSYFEDTTQDVLEHCSAL